MAGAYLRLQVTVSEPIAMHKVKTLEKLEGNLLCFSFPE